MAQFVVDGHEIAGIDLDAHFDAQVIDIVQIPGRSVADNVAVTRFQKLRPCVERGGQRIKAKR